MASPTPTLEPIHNSNLWSKFQLMGVTSPGTIPRGGFKGFKRETGWDKKKGKGTQGATLTLTSMPPCEGTITIQLFTPKDFEDWDNFVSSVLSTDVTKQKAQGLSVYHPSFSSLGLTTVVIEYYTSPEHQGKGLYKAEIKLIEWSPPPAKDITKTPESVATDSSSPTTPVPVDPRVAALQEQIRQLTAAAKAP